MKAGRPISRKTHLAEYLGITPRQLRKVGLERILRMTPDAFSILFPKAKFTC